MNKALFVQFANDPEIIAKARDKSLERFKTPHEQATHFVWYLMWLTGTDTQLFPSPVSYVEGLRRRGFKILVPTVKPVPGDLVIRFSKDPTEQRLGIVGKTSTAGDFFLCSDYTIDGKRPYRVKVEDDPEWPLISAYVRLGGG